jgi:hypothetical protein
MKIKEITFFNFLIPQEIFPRGWIGWNFTIERFSDYCWRVFIKLRIGSDISQTKWMIYPPFGWLSQKSSG